MTCQDAVGLLAMRRACAELDETVRIREIDNERLEHAETSPCQGECWTAAIEALSGKVMA